ncbi:MAG: MarR family transcriptional regulator [Oceanicaulis sp.]|nr:MarR family transcriptional regulator [Oceanicaulis sp.]
MIKSAERLRQEADSVVIEAAGLTVAQAALLGVVLNDPDATQSDIAVRLEIVRTGGDPDGGAASA